MTKRTITLLPEEDKTNGWAWNLPPRTPRPKLTGDVRGDWVVVGAGWAGLAAARRLAENRPDEKVILVDAGAVSDGASGRNSGFAIDLPHSTGGSNQENEGALGYMRLARAAIASLKEQVDRYDIDCDWQKRGKYHAAVTPKGARDYLEPFVAALKGLGEPYEIIEKDALRTALGSDHFHQAVYTPGCILLNPVALTRGLADTLPDNVTLYEHTPVVQVEESNGARLTVPDGEIRAPKMVIAVNGLANQFGAFEGQMFRMVAHASLTRPLTEAEQASYGVALDWGMTPANSFVGITMRYTTDKRILIRETIAYRKSNRVSTNERLNVRRRHQRLFDERFPMLKGVPLAHTWSGFLALSRNGAPGFGALRPGVWAAVCQNAVGVTKGTISGILAADMACDVDNPLLADMHGLGLPTDLPPEPFLGLGVRGRFFLEGLRDRHEA